MAEWKSKQRELKGSGTIRATTSSRHQPPSPRSPTKPSAPKTNPAFRDLCIGFDLGTSSTKVVVRILPTGPSYIVPLAGVRSSAGPFLAPTRLWVSESGATALDERGNGGWVEGLKVGLMEQPWERRPIASGVAAEARPTDLAAAYVALMLRKAHLWIQREVLPSFGPSRIRWNLNVGIPARDYDAALIKEAFQTVAKAAWHLSGNGDPTIDVAKSARVVDKARLDSLTLKGIEPEAVNVVPEVAAGIATYARSAQRQIGVHLYVDVGATTLDASMFLLNRTPSGYQYVFLSADVDGAHGALRLHNHRASKIGELALAKFKASDPLTPIPQTAWDSIPSREQLSEIDASFQNECKVKLGSVIWKAKEMAPNDVNVPPNGPIGQINVMLGGGGVHLPLYQEAIWAAGRFAAPGGGHGLRVKPFAEAPILRPRELTTKTLPEDVWPRLAIAHGLSYRAEDIGDFVPRSALEPLHPIPIRERSDAVSKDHV